MIRRLLLVVFLVLALPFCALAEEPQITPDVVYGHKDGMALTFDLIKPAKPNGAAVVYIVSGGWYSVWVDPHAMLPMFGPLLAKGYTVVILRHGSAPRYVVPEAVQDVRRAIRFLHLHHADYSFDAERIGVFGASAGGHLTLMLATTADPGILKSPDEVLRQSDKIASAVAFYPPTDLRGWTTNPPEAIKVIPMLRPPLTFDASKEADVSPLLHVTAETAPTLLIHGDKDPLVPIEHSKNMLAALQKMNVVSNLIVVPGGGHGFQGAQNQQTGRAAIDWFDKTLAEKK